MVKKIPGDEKQGDLLFLNVGDKSLKGMLNGSFAHLAPGFAAVRSSVPVDISNMDKFQGLHLRIAEQESSG